MATKEDILEQIVEEYLIHRGYFVKHNVKFRPRRDHPKFSSEQDSNHSDIDVLGFNPKKKGVGKVVAVSCKSWQGGFSPISQISAISNNKRRGGREAWRGFRELVSPKWSEAFRKAIADHTGSTRFTYVTAVARVKGDKQVWETHQPFIDALDGNPLKILTFGDMVEEIQSELTTTLASTEVGRLLQLFNASGMIDASPKKGG